MARKTTADRPGKPVSRSKPTPLSLLDSILGYEDTIVRELVRDEQLFAQDQPAFAIYEVKRGMVQLRRQTVDGRMVVVYTAKQGELLAEAALFATNYHCSAVASMPSTVRGYPKVKVIAALRRHPEKMELFLASFAHQIHALRLQLEIRNTRTAEARLLLYLELRADPSSRRLTLSGPLQDIASELGLTREALYRAVAALEARGAVRRSPGALQLR